MEALPLLELFTQLREAGLPLGIGEYQLVLKAWQSGYGRRDRAALARLCRTVWVKSPEDDRIFQVQFDRLIKHQPAHASGTSATSSTARRLWTPQNIVLGVFAVSSLIFLGGYWLMLPKAKPTKSNSISALPSLINDSSITLYEASLPVVERVPSDVMPTNSSRAADSDSPDQIADEVEERLEEQDNVVKAIPAEVLLTQKTF